MTSEDVRFGRHQDLVASGGLEEGRIEMTLEEGVRLNRIGRDAGGEGFTRRQHRPPAGGGQVAHRHLIPRGTITRQTGAISNEHPQRLTLSR